MANVSDDELVRKLTDEIWARAVRITVSDDYGSVPDTYTRLQWERDNAPLMAADRITADARRIAELTAEVERLRKIVTDYVGQREMRVRE